MEKIIMGSDPLGFELKNVVKEHLISRGYEVYDFTPDAPIDYVDVGHIAGKAISAGEYDRAIIFCGSGMGVHIVAGKYPGVYSAVCESVLSAKLCRIINNCNVLAIGGALVGKYLGIQMADAYMDAVFTEGFSEAGPEFLASSVERIKEFENNRNS